MVFKTPRQRKFVMAKLMSGEKRIIPITNKKFNKPLPKYYIGKVPEKDDFNRQINDDFIDGKTNYGTWGIMNPETFKYQGVGLGIGKGQRYKKTPEGWQKVEG
jgi:hypothetical protein